MGGQVQTAAVQKNTNDEILRMTGITKVYGNGVLANENVEFSVRKGEIHALMGENGAGKSTLMKILFGSEQPDCGEIYYKGERVKIDSPKKAVDLGIGMVYQHFNLADSLSVAENIVVGVEPGKGLLFRRSDAYRVVEELMQKYGFELDPKERIRNLSVEKKQKVEILKTLYRGSRLIILDEPTAVLTPQETQELFQQLLLLKENGYTIIFISHKINEIEQICDRLTILRSGRTMGTYDVKGLSTAEISRMMVGRDVIMKFEKELLQPGEVHIEVKDLVQADTRGLQILRGVTFCVKAGEILGIAGIEGSGQRELAEILTGLSVPDGGSVKLMGQEICGCSPKEIRSLGVSHIHEDRMSYGAAAEISVKENLISNIFDSRELGGKYFFDRLKVKKKTDSLISEFQIKCRDGEVPVKMLSGGNIQKVVVAREMSVNPKVLIANQPTRGVDVGAVTFIHERLLECRSAGCAILLISSDLNEVMEMSDRLIVIHQGRITGRFEDLTHLTEEELGLYMLGLKEEGRTNEEEIQSAD